jgi:hypothetical protein
MAYQIQLRRMTDAARQLITPANGEPVWTTDTKEMYMGDGVTVGGNRDSDLAAASAYLSEPTSVNAAGTDLATATLLTATNSTVANSDGVKGVRLSTAFRQLVVNSNATYNLLVYPNTDQLSIGSLGVGVATTIAPKSWAEFIS